MLARFQKLTPGEAAISVITWGELRCGAQKSSQRDTVIGLLDEFAALVPVLALPETAGASYGVIRAALEKRGEPIGNNDLWIAAHARASNLTLVTKNQREFARVPGLTVRNWA